MKMHDQKELLEILAGEEDRKRQRKDAIRDALSAGIIPVPDEVRDTVAALFVTDAMEGLLAHPGFDLEDKIRSIRTALQLFDQAFADLMDALNDFDAFSRQPEFGYHSHRSELAAIENRIRKEIFAYSELAHSLQDHCRHLRSRWYRPDIEGQISSCFGEDGLHDFICGLRRALDHLQMVEANWLIRDFGPAATSHFVFSRTELVVANPDWNARARRYFDSCAAEIDVRLVAQAYHTRVHAFYDWLLEEADTAPPPEVADYRRCWNANRQRSARMAWRLFLAEFLKRDIDPYGVPGAVSDARGTRNALRLPRQSREQADFIIGIVDEFSACDHEIRALVYRLFRVPESERSD